jgi:hypothetical protein
MTTETPPDAEKTLFDIIPEWGNFLDGLVKELEKADPKGFAELKEAAQRSMEKQP